MALGLRRRYSAAMLGIHHYWLFLATAVLLIITPGQDTFFILGRSLTGGRRSGIHAALGISAGTVIHTVFAALGLSALLATSPYAFTAVKLVGAAYLVYIGVRALLSKDPGLPRESTAADGDHWAAFRQGILTNVLNPKVALFFLALLPQFITAGSEQKVMAFLALGLSFVTLGAIWCVMLAVAAASLRAVFLRRPSMTQWMNRIAGTLFIALGVRLATARQ
jgi:RhtB (resistance to homoserine/threonine) family protein